MNGATRQPEPLDDPAGVNLRLGMMWVAATGTPFPAIFGTLWKRGNHKKNKPTN
jgi:hypothetical protein